MIYNIRNILTIIFLISASPIHAGQIWYENFLIPDKGIWGDEDGSTIHSDFSEINNWYLEYESILVASPDDYARTVSTSGGRFEVRDVEGEITWLSQWINIQGLSNISIQLTAYETGSGSNGSTKYLKAYFRINGNEKIKFAENGINEGNWGKLIAKQNGLSGDSLQLVIQMANHYSADKVTLDEILVTGENEDTLPPFITDVKIQSADSLKIFFNEPVAEPLNKEHFQLISEFGNIPILSVSGLKNIYTLKIKPSEVPDLILVALNIADLSANLTDTVTYNICYFPPVNSHNLVINEIMSDPNPPAGLPVFEYIELFNNAEFPINLENQKLCVDDHIKNLEESILLPGDYIILCSTSASDTLSYFGESLAVQSFPSLKNAGSSISIISEKKVLIDSLYYTEKWGADNTKRNGGWSLERIDPNRFCGQKGNWMFSQNPLGGTPGFENSVKSENQDLESPWLIEIEALNSFTIRLKFNEKITPRKIINTNNFYVNEGIGSPDSIKIQTDNNILLYFPNNFSENKSYTIQLLNLSDECGNLLVENSSEFTWTIAKKGDLVINELLSNPFEGGTDFIELYNRSEKIIHLDHLWLSNGKDTVQLKSVSGEEITIRPSGYLVCTKDSVKVASQYIYALGENIVETEKFPVIYNNEGAVILLNSKFEIADHFYYSEDLHSPVLYDIKGVSLERYSSNTETNNSNNWHSASASVGFATPGIENSQSERGSLSKVFFEPEAFSPNLDGYNDAYIISYVFDKPGYIGNCRIFDSTGKFVMQLVKNEILATEGTLIWNGEDKTGKLLPLGMYIVLFEVFDMDGNKDRFKDAVVLTSRF